jgi:hypothetical protein
MTPSDAYALAPDEFRALTRYALKVQADERREAKRKR